MENDNRGSPVTNRRKASPAFQFYPQDFIAGTGDMSAEEVGGYIRLLSYQWTKQGLPDDDRKLIQMAGCSRRALAAIRSKFHRDGDGLLRNARMEEVRAAQEKWRKKCSDGGRRSAEARAAKQWRAPPVDDERVPF